MSVFDWDSISSGSKFPVFPEGTYLVKINAVYFMVNSTSKNDMAKWEGTIVGGDHNGKTISTVTTLTEKALWKVKMLLSACNVEPEERHKKTELMSVAFKNLLQMACGKSCLWVVTQRKNAKGYLVNDVQEFSSAEAKQEQGPEDISWEE
jgi:hypothetical protein